MDRLGALCFAAAMMIANSTIAQDIDQTVLDCDRYAASNNDVNTTAGRAGVKFKDLNPERAKPACEAAYNANPDVARLAFQLGRVEVKLQNYERAKTLLEDAIAKGYTLAAVELGLLYDNGLGVDADLKKALELYQVAADAGWGVAYSNIGDLYRLGLGVEKDETKALEHYDQAIAKGNEVALGRKAMMLAEGHQQGEDPRLVVDALLKAAIRSDAIGSVELGLAYLNAASGCRRIQSRPVCICGVALTPVTIWAAFTWRLSTWRDGMATSSALNSFVGRCRASLIPKITSTVGWRWRFSGNLA